MFLHEPLTLYTPRSHPVGSPTETFRLAGREGFSPEPTPISNFKVILSSLPYRQ